LIYPCYANLNSQIVLHWRLYIEEFNPTYHYIKGENDHLADALSRLPRSEGQNNEVQQASLPTNYNLTLQDNTDLTAWNNPCFSIILDDNALLQSFLNYLDINAEHPFVLDFTTIAKAQNQDEVLLNFMESGYGRTDKCRSVLESVDGMIYARIIAHASEFVGGRHFNENDINIIDSPHFYRIIYQDNHSNDLC
jgi:hypothetical protein